MARNFKAKCLDMARCFRVADSSRVLHLYDETYAMRMHEFANRAVTRAEIDHLLEGAEISPRSKVLDFGCNTGQLSNYIAMRTGCEVFGIDINRSAIQRAVLDHPEQIFRSYDGITIPFPNETFTHAVVSHVIGHVPDPVATLREIRRCLESNARILLVTPNRSYKLAMAPVNVWNRYQPDPTVLRYFTKRSLIKTAEQAGFLVEQCEHVGEMPFGIPIPLPSLKMRLCLRALRANDG